MKKKSAGLVGPLLDAFLVDCVLPLKILSQYSLSWRLSLPDIRMNALGIELNNYAVHELKKGNLERAFDLLSYACETATSQQNGHANAAHTIYRYTWEDCSRAITKRLNHFSKFNEGSMPFMYLKFLTIDTPLGRESVKHLCPCGFAWVLWYNLGIVSALMAIAGGSSNVLLRQSLELLQRVKCRVEPEPLSRHWSMLQLSVLNNQACIFSDLAMSDDLVARLVQMGLTLTKASKLLDPVDQELFQWTVLKLVEDRFAAAA